MRPLSSWAGLSKEGEREDSRIPMTKTLVSNQLSHLKSLRSSDIMTTQQELVGCLRTCASTLTAFYLSKIYLTHGTWLLAFDELKSSFPAYVLDAIGLIGDPRNIRLSFLVHRETGDSLECGFTNLGVPTDQSVLHWICGKSDGNPYWQHFGVFNGDAVFHWSHDLARITFAMNRPRYRC